MEFNELFMRFGWRYFVAALMMLLVAGALRDLRRSRICKAWPSAEGKLVSLKTDYYIRSGIFNVGIPKFFPVIYLPTVEYVFFVDDREYSGKQFFAGPASSFLSQTAVFNLLNKYKDRKKVTVYYNSKNPNDCVLETTLPLRYFAYCYVTLGICLPLIAALLWGRGF